MTLRPNEIASDFVNLLAIELATHAGLNFAVGTNQDVRSATVSLTIGMDRNPLIRVADMYPDLYRLKHCFAPKEKP